VTIFEADADIGGTWLVNTYPGCACDIPSHLYSFSFEPRTDWTHKYSSQAEILDYLRSVAKKYDILKSIRFNTEVRKTTWNSTESHWEVDVSHNNSPDLQHFTADIIISAAGALRIPKVPDQFERFKGEKFHTARWNSEAKLTGKRVAVVGSGASAIQVIPSIAPDVSELLVYQRTPSWIVPRDNHPYSNLFKAVMSYVPFSQKIYRAAIFLVKELTFLTFQRNTWLYDKAGQLSKWVADNHRENSVSDPVLREKLTPKYQMGCKRILTSDDFYPAMMRDNVTLITDKIVDVESDGIITQNGKEKVDVVVMATGFDVTAFMAPVKIRGTEKEYKADPANIKSYLGITMSGFPNLFMLLGPNTGLGHNSVIFMIECQMDYIIQAIRTMMEKDISKLEVKPESEEAFKVNLRDTLQNTVFSTQCGSWYADANSNEIYALWGGNCISYWNATKKFDLDHFNVEHRK